MAHDQFEVDREPPPRAGGGRLVVAGVVGACALGVGLGLWARPAADERIGGGAAAIEAPAPEPPGRRLQIVVDDTPAPIGPLLEVLPAETLSPRNAQAATPPPQEPMAPRRAPVGLLKVAAPEPSPPPEPERTPRLIEGRPPPRAMTAPGRPKIQKTVERKVDEGKVDARKVNAPKVEPAVRAKPKKVVVAREVERPKPAPKVSRKPRSEIAKADKPKPLRGEPVKVAKAAPRKAAEPPPKVRLANLVRAVKATPARLKAEVRAEEQRKAKAARLAAREKAARKPKAPVLKASAPKPAVARPEPKPKASRPVPRGEGPLRMVRNTCVSSDPGEAMVCANPRLSVRERQLQRAYREAEAAGVPADQLRRQQQRWLAARAAAAREAPWAVEEAYEARIAELNDQSRSGDSY